MSRLVITDAHLLDAAAGELTGPAWIDVADGRIAETGTGTPPSPDDARVIDARGATVMPGLIDCHAHPMVTSVNSLEVTDWPPSYAVLRATTVLRDMLQRGFTTVRDMGGADFGVAKAIDDGVVPGPRLIYGTRALSQTGGHGDTRGRGEDVLGCSARGMVSEVVDGTDALRRAIREHVRRGAAHVKIMASGGVASPTDEIGAVQYSADELAVAVEEAANARRYVAAHAYHPAAINRALEAGVRSIEHGNLIDQGSIELLLANDAYLVPTLVTYDQLAERGEELGLPPVSVAKVAEVRDAGLGAFEAAHRAGANIAFGTDLLAGMHAAQLDEFRIRAQVATPAAVIRSATVTAAKLIGKAGELGVIAPGSHADLLVVDGDPLTDISVLTYPARHLHYVIKAGDIVATAPTS